MPPPKSSFLDKVLGRIGRLDADGLQSVVQRLARERSFLETLFNTIEDGVLVVDEEGRILYSNQAVSRLVGIPSEGVEGQPVTRFLPELDWAALAELDRAGGQRFLRHEFEVQYPSPRFLRLYAAPLDGEAVGKTGMALILHDATEARRQTFEAIESERLQALTLLAASVAHEIGNPLNALSIHLQLMEREIKKLRWTGIPPAEPAPTGLRRLRRRQPAPPAGSNAPPDAETLRTVGKLQDYLTVAKGEITRLDYIITEFLQALRPSPPQIRSASLNAVVTDTLTLLRPELENRALAVVEKLQANLPDSEIDPAQIKQVLVNLIKNAMQAMTRGGCLTVETGSTPEAVWVSIADTGGGIPSPQLQKIFEPFYTTKKKGSGLGLMIVQRLIRSHSGRIEVESDVGRGTVFRIRLPRTDQHPRLLQAASPPPS